MAQATDVEALTRLIQSDLGLSIQTLRLARSEMPRGNELWRISDCVIHLGPRLLRHVRPLCYRTGGYEDSYAKVEAFWKHSKLVASVAEATSAYLHGLNVNPEQAYLAGLMHNLGRLPEIVDYSGTSRTLCTIQEWVTNCNLPPFIVDVLKSAHEKCGPSKMRALFRVVSFAERWIDLCLPLHDTCMARRNHFTLPLPRAVALIDLFFSDCDAGSLFPFVEILRDCTLGQLDEQPPEACSAIRHPRVSSNFGASLRYLRAKSPTVTSLSIGRELEEGGTTSGVLV
jgi:hypothetical protein